jgi:DNA-binding transcriptional regulator YhcF (GntR family)
MKSYTEILGRINDSGAKPKYLQIADRIRELIDSGQLKMGDHLPSVNQVIKHFSVSRDTVVKAYQELKDRRIIESTPNKAYFVSNVLIHDDAKLILLLTDYLTPYKEKIYYGLLDTLEPGYYIDLVSHNDNFDILKNVYEKYRSMKNCVSSLIIPTVSQSQDYEYFQYVNPGNLLFLDRRIPGLPHPAVWQDFRDGFYQALCAESSVLKKYQRMIFLTKFFTNAII